MPQVNTQINAHTRRNFGLALLAELKAVTVIAERSTPVRLTACDGELTVHAGFSDEAVAESRVPIDSGPAEPFTIAFNPVYLADALKCFHDGPITVGFVSPTAPAQFTSSSQRGFRHALMPIRLSE